MHTLGGSRAVMPGMPQMLILFKGISEKKNDYRKNLKINPRRICEMCNQDARHWSKNFSSMFCTWKWEKQHIQENDIWDLRVQWIPLSILFIFSWDYCVLEFSDSLTGSKSTSDSPLTKLTSNTMHISSLQRVFSIAAPNLREVGENWEYVSKLLQGNVIGKKILMMSQVMAF